MSPQDDAVQDILKRLEAVLDYIRTAEGRAARGEAVDLSGLDRTVGSLCADIEKAPPPVARQAEPQLARLIKGLDTLASAMQEQIEKIKEA